MKHAKTADELVRIRLGGMDCRSKETLLATYVGRVPGVAASSLVDRDTLTALVDADTLDPDALVSAVVEAGLVPEEILSVTPVHLAHGGPDVR